MGNPAVWRSKFITYIHTRYEIALWQVVVISHKWSIEVLYRVRVRVRG